MKLKIALLLALALLAALAWTFVKRPLPVPKAMGAALPLRRFHRGRVVLCDPVCRDAEPRGLQRSRGFLNEVLNNWPGRVRGRAPQGRVLIDAGVGRDVLEHLEDHAATAATLASLTVKQPTVDALAARGIEPSDLRAIVLTHSHWDHVSGLADLREVPVWITPEELAHARSDDEGGKLYRQLEARGPFQLHELAFAMAPTARLPPATTSSGTAASSSSPCLATPPARSASS